MQVKVLLCCAILPINCLDNNSCLKKLNDIETDHDKEESSSIMTWWWKEIEHLDFVLPTRKSIRRMVAKFSLICYKDMPESTVNANGKSQTVSYITW